MTPIGAILRQRCPRCREGEVYRGSILHGWLAMYDRCPVCDLKYEREQGYFIGAMYVSYLLAIPAYLLLVTALWLGLGWPYGLSLISAVAIYLPFVPIMMRMSRVIWMHIDQAFDPQR